MHLEMPGHGIQILKPPTSHEVLDFSNLLSIDKRSQVLTLAHSLKDVWITLQKSACFMDIFVIGISCDQYGPQIQDDQGKESVLYHLITSIVSDDRWISVAAIGAAHSQFLWQLQAAVFVDKIFRVLERNKLDNKRMFSGRHKRLYPVTGKHSCHPAS